MSCLYVTTITYDYFLFGRMDLLRRKRLWGGQGILRLRWVGYYTNWAGGLAVLFCEYRIYHTF